MNWKWADFWGSLMPKKEPEPEENRTRHSRFSLSWGTPTGKIIAVTMIVVFFAGMAVWIIYHVVRFFGQYWGMVENMAE